MNFKFIQMQEGNIIETLWNKGLVLIGTWLGIKYNPLLFALTILGFAYDLKIIKDKKK